MDYSSLLSLLKPCPLPLSLKRIILSYMDPLWYVIQESKSWFKEQEKIYTKNRLRCLQGLYQVSHETYINRTYNGKADYIVRRWIQHYRGRKKGGAKTTARWDHHVLPQWVLVGFPESPKNVLGSSETAWQRCKWQKIHPPLSSWPYPCVSNKNHSLIGRWCRFLYLLYWIDKNQMANLYQMRLFVFSNEVYQWYLNSELSHILPCTQVQPCQGFDPFFNRTIPFLHVFHEWWEKEGSKRLFDAKEHVFPFNLESNLKRLKKRKMKWKPSKRAFKKMK